jgi:hypothetical protein
MVPRISSNYGLSWLRRGNLTTFISNNQCHFILPPLDVQWRKTEFNQGKHYENVFYHMFKIKPVYFKYCYIQIEVTLGSFPEFCRICFSVLRYYGEEVL